MLKCWRPLAFLLLLFSHLNCYANTTLLVEPDMGRAPLLNAIKQAHSSVDLVMYGMTDESFVNALIRAQAQQKNVRILLQHYPYMTTDENLKSISALQAAHMSLRWPDDRFKLTHQKTFVIDDNSALVLTFNLTHSSFTKERNFGLLIDDPKLVNEIEQVFTADWQHTAIAMHDPDLVFSPDSRGQVLALINSARTSIKIYAEGLSDYEVVGALARAAHRGVEVAILTSTYHDKKPSKQFNYLERAGVTTHFSKKLIIHAKVMIIDGERALLGSINFTRQSINNNRELSIIIHDPKVIHQLNQYFTADWGNEHAVHKNRKMTIKQALKILHQTMRQLAM